MTLKSVNPKHTAGPPSPEVLKRIADRVQEAENKEVDRDEEGQIQDICTKLGLDVGRRKTTNLAQKDLPTGARYWYRRLIQWVDSGAVKIGDSVVRKTDLSSVALSLTAALFFGAAAVTIYTDHLVIAGGFLLLAGAMEAIDANAAKASLVARRDVYIDYMVDRVSDIFLFGAIAGAYVEKDPLIMWLSLGTLVCSLLSSYGRAQAEALRFSARSRFGRGERLTFVFLGLIGTAVLHVFGSTTDMVLIVCLWCALGITVFTLLERFVDTIRTESFAEVTVETWDDESFLPRLMDVLGSREGFAIVERGGKDRLPSDGEVVYIDRYKDRTRVRIYKRAI